MSIIAPAVFVFDHFLFVHVADLPQRNLSSMMHAKCAYIHLPWTHKTSTGVVGDRGAAIVATSQFGLDVP